MFSVMLEFTTQLNSRQQKRSGLMLSLLKGFKRKTIPIAAGMVCMATNLHHIHCRPLEKLSKYRDKDRNEKLQKFRIVI